MVSSKDYLKGKGRLDEFSTSEILLLKGKNARGTEDPKNPKAPRRGMVLNQDHVYQVGAEMGKVNRECAHYLVKSGAAVPKPPKDEDRLCKDYKARCEAAKVRVEAALADEVARENIRAAKLNPELTALIDEATKSVIDAYNKNKAKK